MKTMRVAGLVPGRVRGELETDPARSGGSKILLLRQKHLGEVSVVPGGLVLVDAAPFSHPVIHWLGSGILVALVDAEQAALWERGSLCCSTPLAGMCGTGKGIPSRNPGLVRAHRNPASR